jgi:signal transduction histidine kinase
MDEGSDAQRLGRELEAARARLADMEAYYKALFATVSHDVRAPLGVILGALGELGPAASSDPDSALLLRLVHRSAARLAHYTANILELSRMDSGRFALRMEAASLREVVQRGIEAARRVEEGSAVEIEADLPVDAVEGMVDAARVQQIVANLVLRAHGRARGRVAVRLHVAEGAACIEVTDDGRSEPTDSLPALFDVRQALGDARASGLELPLAARLAEAHGGRAWAEKVAGPEGGAAGLRCVVELPLAHPRPGE